MGKRASALYLYSVAACAAAIILYGVVSADWSHWQMGVGPDAVLFWLIACAGSNLLPAPVTQAVEVTMSGPVNLAIAYLFAPPVAAAVVAFGSLTDWELRRETTFPKAAFNRGQLAVATAAASVLLHISRWGQWRIVAAILGYNLLNLLFVMEAQHLLHGVRLGEVFRRMVTPVPSFVGSYLVLGCLGVIFALVYQQLGWWAVAPFLVPLLFARYALRHSKQLEQAQRERRALADKLIDERERERARIASDMHDLVLQRLAAVQIQSDNITSALKAGKSDQAAALASMVKQQVAGAIADIRTAIADLRRSALDGADLGGTLDRYVRAFQAETAIDVDLDVDGLEPGQLPLPVALLLYECTQEALTNVARHAGASHVDLLLHRLGDSVELKVRDNGRGPSANGNGGVHLGLTLTKDKVALVGGGAWFEGCEGGGAQVIVRIPVRSTD
ncbi:MAG TPA: sensor histidine kinase [Actinomycetota bacterium]|nr:sensor histidine kinase [Actinomycetota bacterium]